MVIFVAENDLKSARERYSHLPDTIVQALPGGKEVIGSVKILNINTKLFYEPSNFSASAYFLPKNSVNPVVNKIGNFVELDGGGYVYLNESGASYTPL